MAMRRYRDPASLVKLRRGANYRVILDTINGPFSLRARYLRNSWPSLFEEHRRLGNRVVHPLNRPGFFAANPFEQQVEQLAWDYLGSRCKHQENQNRYGYQPFSIGTDPESVLYEIFNNAMGEILNGNPAVGIQDIKVALTVFARVCRLLREMQPPGFGQGLYVEVIEIAKTIANLVGELDYAYQVLPYAFYSILEALDELDGGDLLVLKKVILALSPVHYQELLKDAWNNYAVNAGYLDSDVIFILTGVRPP